MTTAKARSVDTLSTAMVASDSYIQACSEMIWTAMLAGGQRIDSRTPDETLMAAFEAHQPGSGQPIVDAAHGVLANYRQFVDDIRNGRGGGAFSDMSARRFQMQLSVVAHAADDVVAALKFGKQAELDTATTDLGAAEQELAAKRKQLEAAVDAGDIAAVMELRMSVELELPARVAGLTATVLGLAVERTECARHNLTRRQAAFAATSAKIQAEIEDAQTRIVELTASGQQTGLLRIMVDNAVSEFDRDTDAMKVELDGHRAQFEREKRAALRRIAGLSSTAPEAAPSPVEAGVTTTRMGTAVRQPSPFQAVPDPADSDPHGGIEPRPLTTHVSTAPWHRTRTREAAV